MVSCVFSRVTKLVNFLEHFALFQQYSSFYVVKCYQGLTIFYSYIGNNNNNNNNNVFSIAHLLNKQSDHLLLDSCAREFTIIMNLVNLVNRAKCLYSTLRVERTLDLECAFHTSLSLTWLPRVLPLGNFEIRPHGSTSNLFGQEFGKPRTRKKGTSFVECYR